MWTIPTVTYGAEAWPLDEEPDGQMQYCVTRPGANPVPVVCPDVPLYAQHSTGVGCAFEMQCFMNLARQSLAEHIGITNPRWNVSAKNWVLSGKIHEFSLANR